ncbi:MAG: hypothetical protein V1834_00790 [Candidatus Micrarchaeota archaeon]
MEERKPGVARSLFSEVSNEAKTLGRSFMSKPIPTIGYFFTKFIPGAGLFLRREAFGIRDNKEVMIAARAGLKNFRNERGGGFRLPAREPTGLSVRPTAFNSKALKVLTRKKEPVKNSFRVLRLKHSVQQAQAKHAA